MKKYTYLIIGNSAAGISAVNKLSRLDPGGSILCISDEKEKHYNKCFLADYLSGEKEEGQLFTKLFHPKAEFAFGKKVASIDPVAKTITLSDNEIIGYGKLLIATGSSPTVPPIPGVDAQNLFTFHSLADTQRILAQIAGRDFSRVTIIGAGLSGLEAADALRSQNLTVNLVERSSQVLPNTIDENASKYIEQKMEAAGISFYAGRTVEKLLTTNNVFTGAILDDNTVLEHDFVICATGLKPNSELGAEAGLTVIDSSLSVNEYQQTSNEQIYAAGDVVMVRDQLTGQLVRSTTWPDAMHQGIIAAQSMVGQPKPYPGITPILSSSFFGVKFTACGVHPDIHKREGRMAISCKGSDDEYCMMFVKEGIPVGFIVIGESLPQLAALRRAVLCQQPYVRPPYKQPNL